MNVRPLRRLAVKGEHGIWMDLFEQGAHHDGQCSTVLAERTIRIPEEHYLPVPERSGSLLLLSPPTRAELMSVPAPLPVGGDDSTDFRAALHAQGKGAAGVVLDVVGVRCDGQDAARAGECP